MPVAASLLKGVDRVVERGLHLSLSDHIDASPSMRSLPYLFATLSLAVFLALPAVAQETEPDLQLDKRAFDEEVYVGEEAVFFIAVTNTGTQTMTGVAVEDVLPEGLYFLAAHTTRGHYDAATGLWTVDALGPGQTETLELTTLFVAEAPVQNCATAQTTGGGDAATDCAFVRPKREKMVPLASHVSPDSR
jgi:uncharacterized repeat protein (TIGR01451 family)